MTGEPFDASFMLENATQIGPDQWIKFFVNDEGARIGIFDIHRKPDGTIHAGSARWDAPGTGEYDRARWVLHSLDPLHIEPSLLCGCGNHGWIRDGKWVPA
jgi:hypothetical protein